MIQKKERKKYMTKNSKEKLIELADALKLGMKDGHDTIERKEDHVKHPMLLLISHLNESSDRLQGSAVSQECF